MLTEEILGLTDHLCAEGSPLEQKTQSVTVHVAPVTASFTAASSRDACVPDPSDGRQDCVLGNTIHGIDRQRGRAWSAQSVAAPASPLRFGATYFISPAEA